MIAFVETATELSAAFHLGENIPKYGSPTGSPAINQKAQALGSATFVVPRLNALSLKNTAIRPYIKEG
jgi:hypothetical protein